ncbi:PF13600 domain protein [Leptospira santarosai str. CBC1416]|uniref:PF13600 domain protein n=1 Tax=Leptospira santarosai str. CBC1416 TaxID=1193059 RepID=M6VLP6_9LEPT|nr:PF13600 domain protein [Leptospira santarosai str. CBC1416]
MGNLNRMRQAILPLRIGKKLFPNLILIFLILTAPSVKSQDESESENDERISASVEKTDPSRIQSVVLYSSFAYVTRNLRIKIKAGNSEIYLGEIPDRVSERTISVRFPDSSKKIKIRGIRGRIRVERKARTKEIASLLKRQEILNDQIRFLSSEIEELIEEEKVVVKISPIIKKDPAPQEEIADPEFLSGFQKQYQEHLNQLSLIRRKKLETLDQVREESLVVDARLNHLGRLEAKQKKKFILR